MKLVEIVPSLEERHGGPSKSVEAMARALVGAGNEVELLATHPNQTESRADGGLTRRVFLRDRPRAFCPSAGLRAHLAGATADVIHHHSLWLRSLHYAHLRAKAAGIPLVISPRGMMSAWAWGHHRWRKQLARHLLHPGAFEAAAGWHATSPAEADEIRARGFAQPVCVAPNGVTPPTDAERAPALAHWRQACPDVQRRRTAVFYSRFHRKKRVLELIDLWLEVAPPDWVLLMVGLPEEYTPAQLDTYVLRASGSGRVHVFDGHGRPPPYAAGSLFLLPSHNENFGLVVAEAMAHGLPALVTDTTPWQVLSADDAGWCVPWSDYPAALRAALAESPDALAARGERGRRRAGTDFSWQSSARLLQDFYAGLRPASARP